MMNIRFLADADFNQIIVRAVQRQEPSVDILRPHAAGLAGLDDLRVLAIAAAEHRILLTHDRKTMPYHHAQFIQTATSAGVLIVSRKIAVSSVAEEIILVWAATEPAEWQNRIWTLPL